MTTRLRHTKQLAERPVSLAEHVAERAAVADDRIE